MDSDHNLILILDFLVHGYGIQYARLLGLGNRYRCHCTVALTIATWRSLLQPGAWCWRRVGAAKMTFKSSCKEEVTSHIHGVATPMSLSVVNGGCVVVGKPHPSHLFTKFHPLIYEIARATYKLKKNKTKQNKLMTDERSMFARWRGWLFITSYENSCVGSWRFPKNFLSSLITLFLSFRKKR